MSCAPRVAAALCLGLLSAAATAQTTPSLHAAWLQEVLDLDVAGAAANYRRIAADAQAPQLDRLVAIARATELQQQGVGEGTEPLDPAIVPEVLRQHFALARQPQPVFERELEAGAGDRAAVSAFFATTRVPQLRPLVLATALAAAEQSNPTATERSRQQRQRFLPWSNDPARVLDRIRANDIVLAELDGRTDAAQSLRRRTFQNWRPQPWPSDAAAAWRQVDANLTQWRRERQLTESEAHLLARLQQALDAAAANRPEDALRLLDRMPLYAERLRVGIGR